MDTEGLNPVSGAIVQASRLRSSSSQSEAPAPSSNTSNVPQDSVSLSSEGKSLQQSGGNTQVPEDGSAGEQRRFDLTDNNELVLQIVDSKTQKVVRQIPAEEAIRLRQAIQAGIEDFSTNQSNLESA